MVYEQYWAAKKRPLMNTHDRWRVIAKTLKLSRNACNRLEWIIWYYTKGNNDASLTARHFGIGRSTFHKWYKRFDERNIRSLESKTTKPNTVRKRKVEPIKDERVIALRKQYPYWGKMKLKTLYEQIYNEQITSWYIQRVIESYRLYSRRRKKAKKRAKAGYVKKRITQFKQEPKTTGFLLHLDTVELRLMGLKRYILTAVDDHSRIAYARMYTSHASASAKDFFERLYFLLDKKVEHVHTDNGSEFHKHFDHALQQLQLTHWWSRARTPKDNPENERFNRTFREEFLNWGNFHPDPLTFNKKLTDWLVEYNAIRPHQSLNYLTPLKYAEKTMHLSTRWSSSTLY